MQVSCGVDTTGRPHAKMLRTGYCTWTQSLAEKTDAVRWIVSMTRHGVAGGGAGGGLGGGLRVQVGWRMA